MQTKYIYSQDGRGSRLGENDSISDKEIPKMLGKICQKFFIYKLE